MLSGTLDDFTLADVLRLIAGARRTGGLAVERDGGAGSLFFRDGTVSRAVPRYDRYTHAPSPARAAEDLAFDLMRWERGEFTWTPGAETPPGPDASLEVDELLGAVARRLEELAEIHRLVPSEEAVLTMAPQPPEGAVQINISPAEWRVLVLVDGHRSVSEIAGAAHLDDLEAMKLLYGLAAAGLVQAGDHAPAEPIANAPETVEEEAPEEETPDPEAAEAVEERPSPAATWVLPAPRDPQPAREWTRLTSSEPAPPPVAEEAPVSQEPEPAREWASLRVADADPLTAADEAFVPAAAAGEEPDPFLAELAMEPVSPFVHVPAAPVEDDESPAVDRSTAARELAGLFDDVDDPMRALGGMTMAAPPPPGGPVRPRRVEDDDQVTRGLISRLIDGVKGL